MAELKENQVALRDGTIVEMRETTGADEMIVAAYIGEAMEANAGGAMLFNSCLIAHSIVKVGEQERPKMRGFEDYRDFLATFKGRDFTKIKNLYSKLNGDDEEGNAPDATSKRSKALEGSANA